MSTILSGEKMVLTHSKTNYELPPVGLKEFEPSHSWLENKQIQSALDQRKTLLETERIEKESNLMTADWKPDKHKAEVSRKGKHWETFGHHSDNTDWLFAEEVLFLMEMNCLQCLYNEVPLSIQKGYSILLRSENGCTLNEYRVFAHLCRAGYRVLRHLPDLTVTAYERTIRLDQHMNERKTYGDVVNVAQTLPEGTAVVGQVSEKHVSQEAQDLDECEKMVTEKRQEVKKPVINSVGSLTKRKLRKIQRKNAKLREKLKAHLGLCDTKNTYALRIQQRKKLYTLEKSYNQLQTKKNNSEEQRSVEKETDIEHIKSKNISALPDTEEETSPEIPSERWQPPVVISDLPENIEMTIGSTPLQTGKATIEVIDIADSSSSETPDTDELDSDIEFIQEIIPTTHNHETEEEEDEHDLEIIEVPVLKKEIIVETLSSGSEEEEEEEDRSGSGSERSYDGNWKRKRQKVITKFIRPPTMSHLTFAAVDEFCTEKKSPRVNDSREDSSNRDRNDSDEFINPETSNSRSKRPLFHITQTRNEILDLMPTMAGQNRKLMTLDCPDLRLVPDNIIPKQQEYTFSTNALRARVFRQGFRGRRNFHGPRFSSFNPYYNNTNGNFYSNQLSIGAPQGLFQSPQLSHLLGGSDINSVARGVMQFASALLMNLPHNNGLLPYNPRPHYPMMNQNFAHIDSSNPPSPRFPVVNQNFSYNQPSNANYHGFNGPQRSSSNFNNLFDIPHQRNFSTPHHNRFSDNSNSPVVENFQQSQNLNVDLSRSSESDFDSSDHNFTPPIGNSHRTSRNFRDNHAGNFRKKRGRFRGAHRHHRGGFSQRNSYDGSSSHQVDPAYTKPDVPVPGEQNSNSQVLPDFIPISSSTSNQKSVEIISIDDNDDGFVPRGGISCRFSNKKRRKRKLMRLKEKAKKTCLRTNSEGKTNPEVVFLDSPTVSTTSTENCTLDSVKQENDTDLRVKTETESECRSVKREEMEPPVGTSVKQECVQELRETVKNELDVKIEKACQESSGIRVKVEQGGMGQNVRVEIKIESSSDTSSVVSLPLTNLVKEEPNKIKLETVDELEVKSEAVDVVESVKNEILENSESKEGILETADKTSELVNSGSVENSEMIEVEPMDTIAGDSERTQQSRNESVSSEHTENHLEVEMNLESGNNKDGKASSWAEMKKNNVPLPTFQDLENQDDTENEIEDEDEIKPLLRPKHCKTIGSVLSALQIFTPFTNTPPEDVLRLKISFDLYLPMEFRKSHRGLPQYRIVVFSGSEPLPSPAQLREVNSRFQDRVPVLTAVVTPSSVVCYTFTNVNLPQDSSSYTK